jgi:hypothetical protein
MMVAWESDENSTLDVNHILFEMPMLVLWGRGDPDEEEAEKKLISGSVKYRIYIRQR